MLFNSVPFLFFFLPLSWVLYFLLGRFSQNLSLGMLVLVSSVFYAWQEPAYLSLIFSSIFVNLFIAKILCNDTLSQKARFRIFFGGIFSNIGALLYFKYSHFFIENANTLFGWQIPLTNHALPLAISFFTFQQIAFLTTFYNKSLQNCHFLSYSSSILFFPHLLAGPILKPPDLMAQLENSSRLKINVENLAVGMTIFTIGFFKKVVLADSAAVYVDKIFQAVQSGILPTFSDAWYGVLLFSLQIYFDFSGYSDMAVGLARLFNIHFPINFNSPYKSTSVIDFWRTWHISLSSFLRDNVYVPLGGNKKSSLGKYKNLFLTMLIGGFWHGASWNFIIWGGLHGIYLIMNHALRSAKTTTWAFAGASSGGTVNEEPLLPHWFSVLISRVLLFLLISVTWVFFRATDFTTSLTIIKGLIGFHGIFFVGSTTLVGITKPFFLTLFLFTICLFFPNIYNWLSPYIPVDSIDHKRLSANNCLSLKFRPWKPTLAWALFIFLLFCFACNGVDDVSQFIYYRF